MYLCNICEKQFETIKGLYSHVNQCHKIKTKEYYDTYFKKENEGICVVCGKPTRFYNGSYGYMKHCSNRCGTLDPEVQQKNKETNCLLYTSPSPRDS